MNCPMSLGAVHGDRLRDPAGNAPKAVFDSSPSTKSNANCHSTGTLHCAVGAKGLDELKQREKSNGRRAAPRCACSTPRKRPHISARTPMPAPCSTCAPAPSSLWPMSAAWPRRRSAKVPSFIPTSPVSEVQPAGAQWRVLTRQGAVIADHMVMATDAYTQGPWEIIRREQIHPALFQPGDRVPARRCPRTDPARPRGLLGHAGGAVVVSHGRQGPPGLRVGRCVEGDGARHPSRLGEAPPSTASSRN